MAGGGKHDGFLAKEIFKEKKNCEGSMILLYFKVPKSVCRIFMNT